MKKLVLLNIVDEETFIKEVVNEMPIIFGAKFEFIDMENCLLVDDGQELDAKNYLKKLGVRCVIDE